MYESLTKAVLAHPRFTSRPTPVLIVPQLPLAYSFIRPPPSLIAISDEARAVSDGTPLPRSPSRPGGAAVTWLVSPQEAGNVLLLGHELVDLINELKRAQERPNRRVAQHKR